MKTIFNQSLIETRSIGFRSLCTMLLFTLVLGACKANAMQEGAEWLREYKYGGAVLEQGISIPAKDIYEVTASKVDIAFMELEHKSISELSPTRAMWFTGPYYTCPAGKKAYLTRAVYGHAGTGTFSVDRLGKDLLIVHQSLGRSKIYQKTALILNLDFEPEDIYISVRIAE